MPVDSCAPKSGYRQSMATAICVISVSLIALTSGCLPQRVAAPPSRLASRFRPSPLAPGPNGLFMDVIHLERPFGDSDLNSKLWATADEEPLPIAVREQLAAQGFRIAVLGGSLPPILKTLFDEEEIGQMNGEHLQLQHAVPTIVQTGGADAVWPRELVDKWDRPSSGPATVDPDKPNGQVNAIGFLRVTPRITSDGCIDLSVLPEIQYGDARREFVPSPGLNGPLDWSIQVGRQSRVLEDLGFTLRLRPGQYALIGCLPLDRESLGARFFTRQKNGQTMQHVVLIQVEPSHEAITARSISP